MNTSPRVSSLKCRTSYTSHRDNSPSMRLRWPRWRSIMRNSSWQSSVIISKTRSWYAPWRETMINWRQAWRTRYSCWRMPPTKWIAWTKCWRLRARRPNRINSTWNRCMRRTYNWVRRTNIIWSSWGQRTKSMCNCRINCSINLWPMRDWRVSSMTSCLKAAGRGKLWKILSRTRLIWLLAR